MISYTQAMSYIKNINRAILASLQHRPLKLGRLIVLQETNLSLKSYVPMATDSFILLVIFSSNNIKQSHELKLIFLYAS